MRYTLENVSLDRSDEDGDPITSAVVAPSSRIAFTDERLSPREGAALEVLQKLVDESSYDFDKEDSTPIWIGLQTWKNALKKAEWPASEKDQIRTNMQESGVAQRTTKEPADKRRTRATNRPGQRADNSRTNESFEREFRRLRQQIVNKGLIKIEGEKVSFASV